GSSCSRSHRATNVTGVRRMVPTTAVGREGLLGAMIWRKLKGRFLAPLISGIFVSSFKRGREVFKGKQFRSGTPSERSLETNCCHQREKEPTRDFVGHKTLQFTLSARVRPTRHRAPHFWVACRGHLYDRAPLDAVCGCRRLQASLWDAL
ncbi:unnamed protein product, partial [Ectocarpus sp. 12 AP-2014]